MEWIEWIYMKLKEDINEEFSMLGFFGECNIKGIFDFCDELKD